MPTYTGTTFLDSVATSGCLVSAIKASDKSLLVQHTSGDSVPEDPLQDFVVFHCHFDGADAATSAADVSNYGHTITFNGAAELDTAWAAFSSASALKTAASAFASVASHAAFNVGSQDLCLDIAWRSSNYATPALQDLFNIGNYTSGILVRTTSTGITIWQNGANSTWATTLLANTDYFLRLNKTAGTWTAALNGVSLGAGWASGGSIPQAALVIGVAQHAPSSEYMNGWVDEVRLTVGATRTLLELPTANFPDSTDVIAGATGVYNITTDYAGLIHLVVDAPVSAPAQNAQILNRGTP